MESNKYYKIAKMLTILSLVLAVGVPIVFFVVSLIGAKLWGWFYEAFAVASTPFFMEFLFIQIPCVIISIIGTVLAFQGKKTSEVSNRWAILGVVSIVLSLIRVVAILLFDVSVFFGD